MNLISRLAELKKIHGLDDERPSTGASGPQKMASGLICRSLMFGISSHDVKLYSKVYTFLCSYFLEMCWSINGRKAPTGEKIACNHNGDSSTSF